jgi:hypothetical protein
VNKKRNFLYLIFFLQLNSFELSAYVHNQTRSGTPIHWDLSSSTQIEVYVNSANSLGITSTKVQTISQSSVDAWNNRSRISMRKNETPGTNQEGLNEVYFSDDPSVFNGLGVLGVTLVSFNQSSGQILEADVLINDSYPFSTTKEDQNFLGNVLTHEFGHLLGLGHGQVIGSTMFYALARGQSDVSDDDAAGLYSVYPNSNPLLGSVTGKIIGGRNLLAVFGAHVQAISVKTGKVLGSTLSNYDGTFQIDGLPRDDQYYLYTSPIEKKGLPDNYSNVQNDFCESSGAYRGSFYQSCTTSAEGFPQAIYLPLASSSVNAGNITIRCGLDTPPAYLQNRHSISATFQMNTNFSSGVGGSFVGYFSSSDVIHSTKDYFRLNLDSIDWSKYSSADDLFLEVKVMNQIFYSMYKSNLSIKRSQSGIENVPTQYIMANDGWVNIDSIGRFQINRSNSSDNDFEIRVTPHAPETPDFNPGIPFTKSDIFPVYSDFGDNLYFYLVVATIVKANGDGSYSQVSAKTYTISDNSTCPDAMNTYSVARYGATGSSSSDSNSNNLRQNLTCATVEDINSSGNGGGPGSFFVGVFLSAFFAYTLSKYRKMA